MTKQDDGSKAIEGQRTIGEQRAAERGNMTNKQDYVWKGDTWGMTDKDCPECGATLATNFKIDDCTECDYWEVI